MTNSIYSMFPCSPVHNGGFSCATGMMVSSPVVLLCPVDGAMKINQNFFLGLVIPGHMT